MTQNLKNLMFVNVRAYLKFLFEEFGRSAEVTESDTLGYMMLRPLPYFSEWGLKEHLQQYDVILQDHQSILIPDFSAKYPVYLADSSSPLILLLFLLPEPQVFLPCHQHQIRPWDEI